MSNSYRYTALYPSVAILSAGVAILFVVVTFHLFGHLYRKDHNWIEPPTKWTKRFALTCCILYTITYFAICGVYTSKSITHAEDSTITAVFTIIAVITYISALICFHIYLLKRIQHFVMIHHDITSTNVQYPCHLSHLHHIVYLLLIIMASMYVLFSITRGDPIMNDKLSEISILFAFISDFTISVVLLIIYIKSIHTMAIRSYFRIVKENELIDTRQHELMLKAARVSVVQFVYIVWSFILYLGVYLAISTQDQRNRISDEFMSDNAEYILGLVFDFTMLFFGDLLTILALYFGFEFGHSWYEKCCCCCVERVQNLCEDMVRKENDRYNKRLNGGYVEMEVIVNGTADKKIANLIVCCCCPVNVQQNQ